MKHWYTVILIIKNLHHRNIDLLQITYNGPQFVELACSDKPVKAELISAKVRNLFFDNSPQIGSISGHRGGRAVLLRGGLVQLNKQNSALNIIFHPIVFVHFCGSQMKKSPFRDLLVIDYKQSKITN